MRPATFKNPKGCYFRVEKEISEILTHIAISKGNAAQYMREALLKQLEADGYLINGISKFEIYRQNEEKSLEKSK